MKARIKNPDNIQHMKDHEEIEIEYLDDYGNTLSNYPKEIKSIDTSKNNSNSIDWEQRRFELVKAIAQEFMSHPENVELIKQYYML